VRIGIYGAGAVGGNFAARLARAGHRVSIVARGEHLIAVRRDGLVLIAGEERLAAEVTASSDAAELGQQDLVIATLKAPALPDMAARIAPMLSAATPVVFAQNGIPWWYGDGAGERLTVAELALLDPTRALRTRVGVARTIGAVVSSSNEIERPGVIRNSSPGRNQLTIGEVDDSASDRIVELRALLVAAGIASPPVSDIRQAVWTKLINNLRASLLSLLTDRTSREVFDDPVLRPIVDAIGAEAAAIAAASGVDCTIDPRPPAAGHPSSMLQDHRRGRSLEVEALLHLPLAFARAARVAAPTLATLAALVSARR
jgi:2-dehydropantoate 2-reductase